MDKYEQKLQQLREKYKEMPHLASIIERQARAIKIAQEIHNKKQNLK
jgi:hypothetical protein